VEQAAQQMIPMLRRLLIASPVVSVVAHGDTMPKNIDKCIFCGAKGPLTGEHVLSKRFHPLFPRTTGPHKRLFSVEWRAPRKLIQIEC
jgi:hypothetical protein